MRKLTLLLCFVLFTLPILAKKPMVILALGDSLTYGYGIDQNQAFPKLLENKLNKKFKKYQTRVINAGISGSTTQSALSRLQKHIEKEPKINILLLALGANDGLRGFPISSVQKNLQDTIQLSLSKKIPVVLAGMKLPPSYGMSYSASFYKIYRELAKKNDIAFIPFLLRKVAMVRSLNLPDGIHPNEAGHQIMAKTIFPYLKKFY